MNLSKILEEFSKFNSPNFRSYAGCNDDQILELEKNLNYSLPTEFKNFLLATNGANINCHELYGIKTGIPAEDLLDNYFFETKEAGNPMPAHYLPIYPDGMGNHNCLDLKTLSPNGEKCNVIFWQHDRLYTDDEQPDIDATSFTLFLENLLKEMSENYNYDGTEKK